MIDIYRIIDMFKNMRVGLRLGLSFAVVISFFILIGATAWWSIAQLQNDLVRATGKAPMNIHKVDSVLLELAAMKSQMDLAHAFPAKATQIAKELQTSNASIMINFNFLHANMHVPRTQAILQQSKTDYVVFYKSAQNYLRMLSAALPTASDWSQQIKAANNYYNNSVLLAEQHLHKINTELRVAPIHAMASLKKQSASQVRMIAEVMIILALISVALGIWIAWWTTRSITQPLVEVMTIAERVANGDLTVRVVARTGDETGRMMESMATMVDHLKQIIGGVRIAADDVTQKSVEIDTLSQGLRSETTKAKDQSDSIFTAAKAMNVATTNVAQHMEEIASNAQQAKIEADNGGRVIGQTLDAMNEIVTNIDDIAQTVNQFGKSSARIGEIVSTINDIANKTNMLALNAAIEATRAGESGRGFAVVADEVRSLANRSVEAVEAIRTIVETIQRDAQDAIRAMESGKEHVQHGARQGDEARQALSLITGQIDSVSDKVISVASAIEEQSTIVQQVTENILHISTAMCDIDVASEAARNQAERLKKSANLLRENIGTFRI